MVKTFGLPLVVLGVALSLFFLWRLFNLPSDETLVEIARGYFERYGVWIVLISAIIEAALFLGWYYPGGLVILLGVVFAGQDIGNVILVIALTTLGFLIAYMFNYALGKYGWYHLLLAVGLKEPIEKAKDRLTQHGKSAIALGLWHPNVGSFIATAAGILQFPLRTFLLYALGATAVWNIFWGILAFFLGEAAIGFIGIRFILIVVAVWIVTQLISEYRRSRA